MSSTSFRISQFRQWQQDSSRHIAQPSDKQCHCSCCGTDFTGNFCPQCGQKGSVGRITWQTVRQGFSMLWGMDSRSLPYTLWQLLLRPGYMIGDYIDGKRQVSFPPIKMLALVAVFVFLVLEGSSDEESDSLGSYYLAFNYVFKFLSTRYDMSALFFFSLLIVPTYFIFRYAPRRPRHNLPEGFFIEVFDSTIALLLMLVVCLLWPLFSDDEVEDHGIILVMTVTPIVYRSYHQLFGYSLWGTLWRTAAVFIAAALSMAVLLIIDNIVSLAICGKADLATQRLFHRFIPYSLAVVVAIAIPYFISRYTAKRRAAVG